MGGCLVGDLLAVTSLSWVSGGPSCVEKQDPWGPSPRPARRPLLCTGCGVSCSCDLWEVGIWTTLFMEQGLPVNSVPGSLVLCSGDCLYPRTVESHTLGLVCALGMVLYARNCPMLWELSHSLRTIPYSEDWPALWVVSCHIWLFQSFAIGHLYLCRTGQESDRNTVWETVALVEAAGRVGSGPVCNPTNHITSRRWSPLSTNSSVNNDSPHCTALFSLDNFFFFF